MKKDEKRFWISVAIQALIDLIIGIFGRKGKVKK